MILEISLGASSQPQKITAGGDGYVWFAVASAGAVAGRVDVINTSTDTIIITLPIPTNVVTTPDLMAINAGPDGNIWFADRRDPAGAIGRVSLDTQLVPLPLLAERQNSWTPARHEWTSCGIMVMEACARALLRLL